MKLPMYLQFFADEETKEETKETVEPKEEAEEKEKPKEDNTADVQALMVEVTRLRSSSGTSVYT